MENNIFTVKLIDVILPWNKGKELPSGIFLVLTHVEQNLSKVFAANKKISFETEHAKLILYNLLCAVNFLHTANVMHRDI